MNKKRRYSHSTLSTGTTSFNGYLGKFLKSLLTNGLLKNNRPAVRFVIKLRFLPVAYADYFSSVTVICGER